MPFHHVTAGLLYKGNYLSRSLSDSDSDVLASISVEELDEIREAFKVLDRDGNGFISKQELGMAMRSLGYMPSEVELAIIMQRLDMDGDGQVDFEEFMTILGPKLLSSETREGFLGSTIDTIFWQELVVYTMRTQAFGGMNAGWASALPATFGCCSDLGLSRRPAGTRRTRLRKTGGFGLGFLTSTLTNRHFSSDELMPRSRNPQQAPHLMCGAYSEGKKCPASLDLS